MVPDQFSTGADDRLMWSLIMKYSLEGNSDGQPNGNFYLTQDGMKQVSDEVVATHLGFKDEKKKKWVNEAMAKLWPRYDVNEDGFIDVQRGTTFLRQVLGVNELSGALQVQMARDD